MHLRCRGNDGAWVFISKAQRRVHTFIALVPLQQMMKKMPSPRWALDMGQWVRLDHRLLIFWAVVTLQLKWQNQKINRVHEAFWWYRLIWVWCKITNFVRGDHTHVHHEPIMPFFDCLHVGMWVCGYAHISTRTTTFNPPNSTTKQNRSKHASCMRDPLAPPQTTYDHIWMGDRRGWVGN